MIKKECLSAKKTRSGRPFRPPTKISFVGIEYIKYEYNNMEHPENVIPTWQKE